MNVKIENNKLRILMQGMTMHVVFSGDFQEQNCDELLPLFEKNFHEKLNAVKLETEDLKKWDSSLILIISKIVETAKNKGIKIDISGLPDNLQKLIDLAFAVDRKPHHEQKTKWPFIENVGFKTITFIKVVKKVISYVNEVFVSCGRFLTFRSDMRGTDFLSALADCGPQAVGIVALISFLVGLILAFVGAVQLQLFGAQIYVASLVTIGMCRIMGAIMVGIIIAGRTGSAYAATIGTMQVNEELDALQTMGISRVDFLVLPRLWALIISMPILTMLADFMGMIGGAFVGVVLMDLPYQEYWRYAINAFTLKNFLVGVFHGFCFGIIISLCGCYSGLNCGRNADSVGIATTRSVVCAIVWMIVVTGIITVICQELGI